MTALLLSLAIAADCEQPVPVDLWRDGVDAMWEKGLAGDDLAFRTGQAAKEADLACLDSPLSPADAARLHRNRALLALASGDPRGAEQALASVLRIADRGGDPQLPEAWLKRSPELADLSPDPNPPPTAEFTTSLAATVYVDGRKANERPLGQPVVVQVFGSDGALVDATWLPSRDPVPDWVSFPSIACEGDRSTAELVDASQRAEAAFADLDVKAFEAALGSAATGLPCVDGALSPTEAAAIHRLEGVRLYTLGARGSALRSFQQARMLDPLGSIQGEALTPGSPLADLWERAGRSAAPPWVPVEAPVGLVVRVDGIPTRQRPVTLPSVVQLTSPTGRVLWTSYVPAMAALPPLDDLAQTRPEDLDIPPARRLYLEDEVQRRRSVQAQTLLLAGSAALVVSGLSWQANRNAVADYESIETAPEALEGYRRSANRTATAAAVSATLGAGLVGVAFFIEL